MVSKVETGAAQPQMKVQTKINRAPDRSEKVMRESMCSGEAVPGCKKFREAKTNMVMCCALLGRALFDFLLQSLEPLIE